jgi:hypothetical protein
MPSLLLAIGVGLILFGAVVLLRYSDRPGGTFRGLGMEISSKGAGLPLIALGIGFIAFTVVRPSRPGGGTTDPPTDPPGAPIDSVPPMIVDSVAVAGCLATFVGASPADRVTKVEVGMRDVYVVSPPQPLDPPFTLVLTENGAPVGALRLRLYRGTNASSHLFKVEAAVDAACRPAATANATSGRDPRSLVNWDTLRLRLGAHDYHLRMGAEEQIQVGSFSRAS